MKTKTFQKPSHVSNYMSWMDSRIREALRRRLSMSRRSGRVRTHQPTMIANVQSLPMRALDVGPNDGSAELCLFISNGAAADYVALSYCRGGDIPAKIILQTQAARCTSTPLSLLPKTFQHTVIATCCLGFRYLWIDSMCIIQDSAEDWGVESLRMQDAYENAVLTLSALGSTSSQGGMFYLRMFVRAFMQTFVEPYVEPFVEPFVQAFLETP